MCSTRFLRISAQRGRQLKLANMATWTLPLLQVVSHMLFPLPPEPWMKITSARSSRRSGSGARAVAIGAERLCRLGSGGALGEGETVRLPYSVDEQADSEARRKGRSSTRQT
jgi:hypothetical protein